MILTFNEVAGTGLEIAFTGKFGGKVVYIRSIDPVTWGRVEKADGTSVTFIGDVKALLINAMNNRLVTRSKPDEDWIAPSGYTQLRVYLGIT